MISLNLQPPESVSHVADGSTLDVINIWQTIQGEGPMAGWPVVFVRLAGCNLQCPTCDTDYTTNRKIMTVQEVVNEVITLHPLIELQGNIDPWVVFTGGEPFRQNFSLVSYYLKESGIKTQVETNGTLFNSAALLNNAVSRDCWRIVCSPKTINIHEKMKPFVDVLKYIVSANSICPNDGLPLQVLGKACRVQRPWSKFNGRIYIQPEETNDPEQNKKNIDAAYQSCMKHGYILSLQLHKIVGVP